jgi:indole-3-glycerol phosphate synthase
MTILQNILDVKKNEVDELHRKYTRASFTDFEMFAAERLDFGSALRKKRKINVIAEVKHASPSKGVLNNNFNHIKIAESYFRAGADAVSVLTDKLFFKGNISYLKEIAEIKTVPLLRKDFIIDEFQILEAKAHGADAILLIAEALTKDQINDFTAVAKENDLDVLLEIHSLDQIGKIDFCKNRIIGINNRNLENFQVDIKKTKELAKLFDEEMTVVSESGISSKGDLDFIKTTNTRAVLVGEHFIKSYSIEESLSEFLEWCSFAS